MFFRSYHTKMTLHIIQPHTIRATPPPLLLPLTLRDTNHIRKNRRPAVFPPMASLCMHSCHPSMTNDGFDPLLAPCLSGVFIDVGEENGLVSEYGREPCQAREGIG